MTLWNKTRCRIPLFALLVFSHATQPLAGEATPSLSLPIDCKIGIDCFVQNYVDHDASPAYSDFTCGSLSYDGHKGTDIRLADMPAMRQGYAVRAAADGYVRATRDGMEDANIRQTGTSAIQGREAGNSVVVVHGNGWESQYAHLRRGSVTVRQGQPVKRGDVLGLVGLSGNTEFPHLHFEVRKSGVAMDPFNRGEISTPCGAGGTPLWDKETTQALTYNATATIKSGFTPAAPVLDAMLETVPVDSLPGDSKALVFWVYLLGVRQGDMEQIRVIAPDGSIVAKASQGISANKATWLSYAGAKRPGTSWPTGRYRAEYRLLRQSDNARSEEIIRIDKEVVVEAMATSAKNLPPKGTP